MDPVVETRTSFWVVGLEARTSNADPSAIGAAWGRVVGESLADQVPGRLDDAIMAIYCEYAGDHTEPYTYVLGWRVAESVTPPEGMVCREIPGGTYLRFDAKGPVPESVQATWASIWEAPIDRAFRTDYELHNPATPGVVPIFISV